MWNICWGLPRDRAHRNDEPSGQAEANRISVRLELLVDYYSSVLGNTHYDNERFHPRTGRYRGGSRSVRKNRGINLFARKARKASVLLKSFTPRHKQQRMKNVVPP